MKSLLKKVVDLFVLLISVLAFALLVVSITSKKDDDGASTIFGYQMRFVISESMAESALSDVSQYKIKSIPLSSLILIETTPQKEEELIAWYDDVEVGDVLTFKYLYTKQETITHRVVGKEAIEGGGWIITLRGDNLAGEYSLTEQVINTNDTESANYIIGKVIYTNLVLGKIISALKNPIGIIFLIIVPCLVLAVIQIIRIVSIVRDKEKNQYVDQNLEKDREIEALKKELELMKKK